jgi:hypothetical protein
MFLGRRICSSSRLGRLDVIWSDSAELVYERTPLAISNTLRRARSYSSDTIKRRPLDNALRKIETKSPSERYTSPKDCDWDDYVPRGFGQKAEISSGSAENASFTTNSEPIGAYESFSSAQISSSEESQIQSQSWHSETSSAPEKTQVIDNKSDGNLQPIQYQRVRYGKYIPRGLERFYKYVGVRGDHTEIQSRLAHIESSRESTLKLDALLGVFDNPREDNVEAFLRRPLGEDAALTDEWTPDKFYLLIENYVNPNNTPKTMQHIPESKRLTWRANALVRIFREPSLKPYVTIESFNEALKYLVRGGYMKQLRYLLLSVTEGMRQTKFKNSTDLTETFRTILQEAASCSNTANFRYLIGAAKYLGFNINQTQWSMLFASMPGGHAREIVRERMQKSGIPLRYMSKDFHDILDSAKNAEEIVDLVEKSDFILKYDRVLVVDEILRTLCRKRQLSDPGKVFELLSRKGLYIKPQTSSLNVVLECRTKYGNREKHMLARPFTEIVDEFVTLSKNWHINPDARTFDRLFRLACKNKSYNAARTVWIHGCLSNRLTDKMIEVAHLNSDQGYQKRWGYIVFAGLSRGKIGELGGRIAWSRDQRKVQRVVELDQERRSIFQPVNGFFTDLVRAAAFDADPTTLVRRLASIRSKRFDEGMYRVVLIRKQYRRLLPSYHLPLGKGGRIRFLPTINKVRKEEDNSASSAITGDIRHANSEAEVDRKEESPNSRELLREYPQDWEGVEDLVITKASKHTHHVEIKEEATIPIPNNNQQEMPLPKIRLSPRQSNRPKVYSTAKENFAKEVSAGSKLVRISPSRRVYLDRIRQDSHLEKRQA